MKLNAVAAELALFARIAAALMAAFRTITLLFAPLAPPLVFKIRQLDLADADSLPPPPLASSRLVGVNGFMLA